MKPPPYPEGNGGLLIGSEKGFTSLNNHSGGMENELKKNLEARNSAKNLPQDLGEGPTLGHRIETQKSGRISEFFIM